MQDEERWPKIINYYIVILHFAETSGSETLPIIKVIVVYNMFETDHSKP